VLKDDTNLTRYMREYGNYRLHPKIQRTLPSGGEVNSDIPGLIADAALIAMQLFPEYYAGIRFDHTAMRALQQRVSKLDTIAGVIRRARSIREAHAFSTLKFLFYRCCIHFPDQIRNTLARSFSRRDLKRRLERIGNPYCSDISQAVNVLDQLEAPRD
jgi:hypothetical protein